MKIILLSTIVLTLLSVKPALAQTTAIPDQNFEQALINLGIDSDGIINGQVLSSDIENVITLELSIYNNMYGIQDLTGIEGFVNLEELSVNYMEITALDVSQNLQLKYLDCSNNNLTSLDVSNNNLLEYLDIGNNGLDVGPFNYFTEIDLSNNPNIKTIYARDIYENLSKINLKNGNNNPEMSLNFRLYPDTTSPDFDPEYNFVNVCIEVDNVEAAQNNEMPYSAWNITHNYAVYGFADVCNLSRKEQLTQSFTIYPNPASDVLYIKSDNNVTIDDIVIYDYSGKIVREYNSPGTQLSLTGLPKGLYLIKTVSGDSVKSEKLIIN